MTGIDLISFIREDSLEEDIRNSVELISNHFSKNRRYIIYYLEIIRVSKRWTVGSIDSQFDTWKSKFQANFPDGTAQLLLDTENAFKSCKDDEQINKLRGSLLEAVLIGVNGGYNNLQMKNYGWGASVNVLEETGNKTKIKYNCTTPIDENCSRRMTVDYGYWDGKNAKLYECKAVPDGIGCKEIKYMINLKGELTQREISNEVYFVSPSPTEAIKMRLQTFDLSPVYKAFGNDEFKAANAIL